MKKLFLVTIIISNLTLFSGMIKPIDGSSLNYTHVLFEWDQIADAVEYQIQISTSSSFSSILSSGATPSLIYIESENIGWSDTYHWRVRPVYNDGSSGNWPDTFLFNNFAISIVAKTSPIAECASLCLMPFIGANFSNLKIGLFSIGQFFIVSLNNPGLRN